METSPHPPELTEHHVRVPDGVAKILGADALHRRGITGRGIQIAVIDSGFYPHPYYTSRGYKIRYIPTKSEPKPYVDHYGHGTAQLASLFALAPEAEVLAIKCMARDPSSAIEKAIMLKPQILSCAWGFDIDGPRAGALPPEFKRMHELLKKAVSLGITVVSAAGNGQYSFPGCMPEIISVGGVYYSPLGEFLASDLSSNYESSLFPSRNIPDICGIVGNRPYGKLLLIPIPPKARLAKRTAFDAKDGWALFSGTSAATSMASGAAALLLQMNPTLTPSEIKLLLVESARKASDSGCRVLALDRAIEALSASRGALRPQPAFEPTAP